MTLKRHHRLILGAVVLAASFVFLVSGIHVGKDGDRPPFFMDEAHKLGETYFWHLLFERGDIHHPAWTQDFFARTNPTVPKFVFGAVLAACGYHVHDQQLQKDFERFASKWERLRECVPDGMLRVTRCTNALFAAMICLLFYGIGFRIGGLATGLLAVFLLLGNPLFETNARRGLADIMLLFHLTLMLPVSRWSVQRMIQHWRGSSEGGAVLKWASLLATTVVVPGLVIALATGSKLNGALSAPLYAITMVFASLAVSGAASRWRRIALALVVVILALVVAVTVFVAVNPYLYQDPVSRMFGIVRTCRDWIVRIRIHPGDGLFSLRQKVAFVSSFALRAIQLQPSVALWTLGHWLMVSGFSIGIVVLTGRCLSPGADTEGSAKSPATALDARLDAFVVLCWIGVCLGGTTLWLPLMWERYLVVSNAGACLAAAIGLAYLPRRIGVLLDLLAGKSPRNGKLRIVVGTASAATIWTILMCTRWVIAPALLNPISLTLAGATVPAPEYATAVRTHPDSLLECRNLGLLLLTQHRNAQAAQLFEKALSLVNQNAPHSQSTDVLRCRLFWELTQARMAEGNGPEATKTLRQHIAMIERIRDGMVSGDPKLRAEYNHLIDVRSQLIARGLKPQQNEFELSDE